MKQVADFQARVTAYHRQRPRFQATVALSVAPAVAVGNAVLDLPRAFDIDEAVGVQLDAVGAWEGYTRFLSYPLPNNWFSFGDAARGFGRGLWYVATDPQTGITRLTDDTYRDLLRAKAVLNRWDGTVSGAAEVYDAFFASPNTRVVVHADAGEGAVLLGVSGEIPPLHKLMLLAEDYLPARPVTVRGRTLVTTVDRAPLFGFGVDNAFIGGFGRGAFGAAPADLVARGY
ncbi:DUF2612 domain-containing protein [Methylobacterium sp. CCH5-D2]|uniref:DUF2612 domain-containing protein n=1 Tax=Methylobacterium sp. CCH5-D2 TaxID=1768765 RepID=UPI000829F4B6|nr:DUF2612 domain-containing protein [Methylobacterium sp. CCH5-D2]